MELHGAHGMSEEEARLTEAHLDARGSTVHRVSQALAYASSMGKAARCDEASPSLGRWLNSFRATPVVTLTDCGFAMHLVIV